jgi:transposase
VTDPEEIAKTLQKSGLILEKIGLESGSISFWLMHDLKEMGLNAICIESKQMARIISLKVNKTDKNDARSIADAMRCNLYKEVYLKTKESIDIGLQMGVRRTLVDTRTKLKNSIRGYLKAYGVRLGSISHQKFPKTVRHAIQSCETVAQDAIEALLRTYEEVCQHTEKMEEALKILIKKDPVIEIFESIPGVGAITAVTYKAVIGDPHRFADSRDIGAYLGLTPTQYSSGESVKQGRISKCGCKELRALLVECGIVILTRTAGWTKLKAWGLKIMKRSGLNKASVAVARKLAIIMLRMWQEMKGFICGEKKQPSELCAIR